MLALDTDGFLFFQCDENEITPGFCFVWFYLILVSDVL
jgi:hypothetical protein